VNEDDEMHLDPEGGVDDLLLLLNERVGLELEMVPDVGMTVQVAGVLAAVFALAVYLGRWGGGMVCYRACRWT
jgi:hypothetical protein